MAELGALGVARVSTGSLLFRHAVTSALAHAQRLRGDTAHDGAPVSYREIQELLAFSNRR